MHHRNDVTVLLSLKVTLFEGDANGFTARLTLNVSIRVLSCGRARRALVELDDAIVGSVCDVNGIGCIDSDGGRIVERWRVGSKCGENT